jgi:hypothetical protein
MNLKDALYHAVHEYPGGVAALAARMGLAASSLYSMANPNDSSHDWPRERLEQVMVFTGDQRIVQAICALAGGVFVPVGAAQGPLADVSGQMVTLAAEFGDVARAVHDSVRDNRLTSRERDRVAKQLYELISAAAQLGQGLDARVEAGASVLKVAR